MFTCSTFHIVDIFNAAREGNLADLISLLDSYNGDILQVSAAGCDVGAI